VSGLERKQDQQTSSKEAEGMTGVCVCEKEGERENTLSDVHMYLYKPKRLKRITHVK
jgi:hypothetical protein